MAVNKYFNTGTAADIVELLVIQNNLDMRGMILKDFSASMANDGGGKFTFANNALWAAVPAGTLIVLRNNNSAADVTVGGGDYNLDVGLTNTTYFTSGGGTFDIAGIEMVMIKAAGSGTAGVTGSIHALAGGTAGAQFTAAPTPKLIATGQSGTNQFVYANNGTQSIADFNGTDATGAATGLTFGSGNNANNTAYINSLRSAPTPTPTPTPTLPGALQFSAATYSVAENGGSATITVTRTGGSDGAVSVNYATSNGTATSGDYTAASGTLNYANGETSKTFSVTVTDDAALEGDETVNLTLSNPAGGATLGSQSTAVLTIVDNEVAPTPTPTPTPTPATAGSVVISQVYGGGGNAGAFYRYDFIELFNRSSQPVNLNGWSVQYATASGGATTPWNRRTPLTGVIQPGQYFLIREASGANTGAADLPTPDIIGTIAMGGTDGKVALVSNNVDLPNGCPVGGTSIIDFVGYGTADCFEGTAAPQLSNNTAALRTHNGCKDTDLNNLNFTEGPPAPRNSSSTLNVCPAGDLAPDVFSTDPANGGTNTPLASNITVNFDANVNVTDGGFTLSCTLSGPHTLTVTGGPATFTLNPDADFVSGETCTATVLASHVTAQNAAATPMANDYTWTFGTLIVRDPNEHLVMGNPSGAVTDENVPLNYLMRKPQYALSYNNDKGTPNWTSWHLDSSWTTNVSDRQNDFRADDTLPASFKHVQSGYNFATYGFDRGHMTPSADRTSSVGDNSATFLMTNMVPQASGNNQGPWANMENDLRSLLNGSANELYIISGGQGTGGNSTTGHWDSIQDTGGNTVNVPQFTWKVVMVMSRQDGDDVARVNNATRAFAVIMPNNDNIRPDDWRKYLATVDQVEALTGYNFFSNVPEAIQNVIEARLDDTLDTTPVANGQSVTTAEDTQKAITLSATDFNVNNVFTYTVGAPSHGVLSGTAPNLTYTPDADYNGPDSFTFKVNDGARDSNTATVTINVTAVNDAPVANDDAFNTDEDAAAADVNVLGNDTDVENDTLTVTNVGPAAHGTATLVSGVVKYAPAADYSGADFFTYTVSDGHGGTATGTVNVNVAGVNDGPVANNDTAETDEDAAVNVNVVGNDSDPDGDTLSVTAVTQPAHGSATFAGGSITYTPAADYNGSDSFTYTVGDGHGGSATANVSVTVRPVNDNPVAANDSATVAEDSGVSTVSVLGNDTDVDGDALSVSAVTQGAHGAVANNGNSVSYTPNANYNGPDSFTYTVSDGHGGTATVTVSVNVTAVNDNPTAANDAATTDEDTAVSVDVVSNDNDIDGDTLSLESAFGATHGTVAVVNGQAVFTPAANYNGAASFNYVVSDNNGGTATGTVSVTVNAVNDNPVAGADVATTNEDTAVTVNVLANDSDVDGDTLSVQSAGGATKGSVAVVAGGVRYTPNANVNGTDSFTYTVSDGHGGTATGTVSVTINAVNDAPSISNVPATANIAELAAYTFTASAADVDGDGLTFSLVGAPAGASISPSGVFTWTPTEAQGGTGVPFNFKVRVSDGTSNADAPVSVTVTEVNQAPTLAPIGNKVVLPGSTLTFNASGADADLPAQTLTYSLAGAPAGATINPTTGAFSWTPTAAQSGNSYTFNVVVSDGVSQTPRAVTVLVLGPRNVLQDALAQLIALRQTITDKQDGKKLDEAIDSLSAAVEAGNWLDASHLRSKEGDKAFKEMKQAVSKLRDLQKDKKSVISDALLQGSIDQIAGADRLLARTAISEAQAAGADPKDIAKASEDFAKGDADIQEGRPDKAIDDYGSAWKRLNK